MNMNAVEFCYSSGNTTEISRFLKQFLVAEKVSAVETEQCKDKMMNAGNKRVLANLK